jgi:cytochrome bd-type quinol oxidase subunit 1
MEHQTLQGTFLVAVLAAVVAAALAVVIGAWWLWGRRQGRSFRSATAVGFLCAVAVSAASTGWLMHERAQKCGPTVARTLCESPMEWFRSL